MIARVVWDHGVVGLSPTTRTTGETEKAVPSNRTASPVGLWAEILRGEDPGDTCWQRRNDFSAGATRGPGLIALRLWLAFGPAIGRIKIARLAYYINRFAGVAQLEEHLPRKQRVGSSNLPVSSTGVGIPLVLFIIFSFHLCPGCLHGTRDI